MTGIAIPPIHPGTAESGPLWPGIVAAVVLLVVIGLAVWTYMRTRPTQEMRRADDAHYLEAA
jgi:hypothetical protein